MRLIIIVGIAKRPDNKGSKGSFNDLSVNVRIPKIPANKKVIVAHSFEFSSFFNIKMAIKIRSKEVEGLINSNIAG